MSPTPHFVRRNRSNLGWAGMIVCLLLGELITLGAKKPNIVFIFSDDHALQAIGAYGSKINKTPNIDRLAREGATFVNSFCAKSTASVFCYGWSFLLKLDWSSLDHA